MIQCVSKSFTSLREKDGLQSWRLQFGLRHPVSRLLRDAGDHRYGSVMAH